MEELRQFVNKSKAVFRVSPAAFAHTEVLNSVATKRQRFHDGLEALEPSIEKVKHRFTMFGMLDSRADSTSSTGAAAGAPPGGGGASLIVEEPQA